MSDPASTRPVWLVLLNWNGRDDTLDCLRTLEPLRDQAHVLLVDNGSTDGSEAAVANAYPWVELLQTGENLGYAGGNNRGLRRALDGGAQVIGVLNNDTLVEAGFLAPLLERISAQPQVIVSPDIRYAAEPGVSWFRGGTVE